MSGAEVQRVQVGDLEMAVVYLADVTPPALIVAADRDMITLDHTVAMFRALPATQLSILPGVGHDVPRTDPHLVAVVIERFLAS